MRVSGDFNIIIFVYVFISSNFAAEFILTLNQNSTNE